MFKMLIRFEFFSLSRCMKSSMFENERDDVAPVVLVVVAAAGCMVEFSFLDLS